MASAPRLYDLMIALSPSANDERRAKVLSDVQSQIEGAGGQMERNDDWHLRPLAYEIDKQTEGEYHLLQFTGATEILESLSYNLRIDDAVLRFRIIRNLPGTPPAPEPPPVVAAASAAAGAGPSADDES